MLEQFGDIGGVHAFELGKHFGAVLVIDQPLDTLYGFGCEFFHQ